MRKFSHGDADRGRGKKSTGVSLAALIVLAVAWHTRGAPVQAEAAQVSGAMIDASTLAASPMQSVRRTSQQPPPGPPQPPTGKSGDKQRTHRLYVFPPDHSLGMLNIRPRVKNASEAADFHPLGDAKGTLPVPYNYDVQLVVVRDAVKDMGCLEGLSPRALYSLSLNHTDAGDSDVMHIRKLTALVELDLRGTRVGDAGLAALTQMKNLKLLRLSDTKITDAGMPIAGGLASLAVLDLPTQIGAAGLAKLAERTTLRELSLKGNQNLTGPTALGMLKPLTGLTRLDVSESNADDDAIKAVAALTHLTSLHVARTRVGDEGVAALAPCRRLSFLDLTGAKVSDAAMKIVGGMTELETLRLGGTRVTDEGLADLCKLEALTSLSLGGTGVTDAGAARLASIKSLQVIELHDTKITDAGLAALGDLEHLKRLTVRGTGVTKEGVSAFMQKRPGCSVVQ